MTEKTIILEDSPEAASIQTVTGWVSRTGHFWGDDERMARYDGSTHKRCECGEIIEQRSYCRKCSDRKEVERWQAMPEVEWNGSDYLYSQTDDQYFRDEQEIADYCADCDEPCTPDDLRLVICTPNYLREVDLCEDNSEKMPEDGDESCFTPAVQDALEALNKAIRESRTPEQAISWSPGKTKPKAGSIDISEQLAALAIE